MAISMRDIIEFINTDTIYDEEGYPTSSTKAEYKCHANIMNFSNSEFFAAYTTNNKIVISFKVRFCNFTKKLKNDTKKYKIKFENNYYNIIDASDYKNTHQWIILKAETINNN